jgi:hypothetical protein
MQATMRAAIILTKDHLCPRDYVLAQNMGEFFGYDSNMGRYFSLDEAIRTCEELNDRKYVWNDPAFYQVNGGWFVIHKIYYNRLALSE